MTTDALAPLLGGVGLLERAINYTLGVLHPVRGAELSAPTPCGSWTLHDLLVHVDESLLALHEAAGGHVDLAPAGRTPGDPVTAVRNHASGLLGAWTSSRHTGVTIGDAVLTTGILATAGALEVAVHGWDVARATGRSRPLPPALAEELLALCPLLVRDLDRPARFAAPVPVPASALAGDRLLAFLGRRP
ncbi:TIGR03086 family metal-binding protein [Actinophytocola sp.]|uniref:TIGR03086 family metal-binding protein n=1 Tax=Actinophytocola sp. TaxID=1872138 RepID=UPI003D6B48E9